MSTAILILAIIGVVFLIARVALLAMSVTELRIKLQEHIDVELDDGK